MATMSKPPHQMTDEMRRCVQICHKCHDACLEAISMCIHEGGEHALHHHLLLDCAQICHTSGDFILRGSDLYGCVCRACAEVCKHCAENCAKLGGEQMRECTDACKKCAESCGKLAA